MTQRFKNDLTIAVIVLCAIGAVLTFGLLYPTTREEKEQFLAAEKAKGEDQTLKKANQVFDSAIKEAIRVTADPCYGNPIKVLHNFATGKSSAVILGQVIAAEENNLFFFRSEKDSVVLVKRKIAGGYSSQDQVIARAPNIYSCP